MNFIVQKKKTKKNSPLARVPDYTFEDYCRRSWIARIVGKKTDCKCIRELAKIFRLLLLPLYFFFSSHFAHSFFFCSPVDILLAEKNIIFDVGWFCVKRERRVSTISNKNVVLLHVHRKFKSRNSHISSLLFVFPSHTSRFTARSRWITITCRCLLLAARGNRTKQHTRNEGNIIFVLESLRKAKEAGKWPAER